MRKLGGILAIGLLALTACGSPADEQAQFREAIKQSATTYANMPDADLDEMAKQICEHYADGFTTQDLRDANGERLAVAGEAALSTVCKTP
ncbi:hypothetical protein ART_1619 [Arthrobacter sp. PAMC 25486]|uniref:hypothetical protein n=1 Tax=Arthrobacter sp. PAMC 25486 TaxID=1494608 RepID=UPI000535D8A5|nr:hypothetical protein [Arthrobacter sp. PAMC 25486]AIY01218.1 hypothetical protein ART_1619 [Arthrobacter sp. PAMC 25486]